MREPGDFQPSRIAATATSDNPEALERLYTLLADQEWRLNNLYWIKDKSGNKVKFRMNAVQRHAFEHRHTRLLEPKSRQHGLSTLWALYALDLCVFNPNKTAGIIDRTDAEGQKKLDKMKFAYDHLDDESDPATCMLGAMVKQAVPLVKANANELRWANDSTAWTAVSFRGGTVQFLHVSELGPIAYADARRAEEIRTGAFPAAPMDGMIVVESTHKGGRHGMLYEMIEQARNMPAEFTQADWRLYFYGWHLDPNNSIEEAQFPYWTPAQEHRDYFESLNRLGIKLTRGQQLWWSKKLQTDMQGDRFAMSLEYPATLEEMLDNAIRGAIYGSIVNRLREEGRVIDFPVDPSAPLYTSWDLGRSDLTCIWLWQFVGPYPRMVSYFASRMTHVSRYVQTIQDWEFLYHTKVACNFLPHDAAADWGSGSISWLGELEKCGLKNISIVPKSPDVWIGINQMRRLLPMCMINPKTCGASFGEVEGVVIPSGLESLECYRVEKAPDGEGVKEMPVHNIHSHGADAARTMAEALSRGMVKGGSAVEKTFRNRQTDVPMTLDGERRGFEKERDRTRAVANIHGGRRRSVPGIR